MGPGGVHVVERNSRVPMVGVIVPVYLGSDWVVGIEQGGSVLMWFWSCFGRGARRVGAPYHGMCAG
jgi:hypothetical protein